MNRNTIVRSLALASALALTVPVFAKPVQKSLAVTHSLKFGKVDVKAGDYRAMIDDNHITLLNGKKVIAESAGRWEDRSQKSPNTVIVSNADGQVMELRFEGKSQVFVLSE
jgi:hypothetical protein